MIIITGTKRSGTSMWMQLLKAAGFPPIGEAFPRNWGRTIRDANPEGFYESELRRGIYYKTNPDPKTGVYLFPEDTQRHVVKVFIPGLIRTDRAFIGRVVATVRPWRQYVRSLDRLYRMEQAAKAARKSDADPLPDPAVMSPVIEWWVENFSLFSDIVTRRYPFIMVAYESVLEDPETSVRAVFDWLGDGDADAAVAQVEPELRTQTDTVHDAKAASEAGVEPEVVEVFDELYEVVRSQEPIEQAFVDRLNETNERLSERIQAEVRETTRRQLARRRLVEARLKARKAAGGGTGPPDSAR